MTHNREAKTMSIRALPAAVVEQEQADDRFGLCPNCKGEPTLLQPGTNTIAACPKCKLGWYLDPDTRDLAERVVIERAREQANRLLDECDEVQPTYNPDTLARMQARQEWQDAENERIRSECARTLENMLAALAPEQRTAFLAAESAYWEGDEPDPAEQIRSLARFLTPTRRPFPDDVEAERFRWNRYSDFDSPF